MCDGYMLLIENHFFVDACNLQFHSPFLMAKFRLYTHIYIYVLMGAWASLSVGCQHWSRTIYKFLRTMYKMVQNYIKILQNYI